MMVAKIRDGRARVSVGARSSIFAPFKNLGIIIIDEEHESTYKQEIIPDIMHVILHNGEVNFIIVL